MPEGGTPVLQIQIRDNAQEAARGLDALATALEKVQRAVSGGLSGLSTIAGQIDTLKAAVERATTANTAGNLHKIANAIARFNKAAGSPGAGMQDLAATMERISKASENAAGVKAMSSAARELEKTDTGKVSEKGTMPEDEARQIANIMVDSAEAANLLQMRIQGIKDKLTEGIASGKMGDDALARMTQQAQRLQAQYDALISKRDEMVQETHQPTDTSVFRGMVNDLTTMVPKSEIAVMKLDALKAKLENGLATGKLDNGQIANLVVQIQKAEDAYHKLAEAERKAAEARATTGVAEAVGGVATNVPQLVEGEQSMQGISNAMGNVAQAGKDAAVGVEQAKQQIVDAANAAKPATDAIKDQSKALKEKRQAEKEAAKATEEHARKMKELRTVTINTRQGILGLVSSFARMAKYRLFRYLIREISEGFRTGFNNVREYSKAIGSELSPAMDALNNASLKMKNSLGAMLAPVLMQLVPLIQNVITWVINASNAINQFFALLNGQATWTRAIDVTNDALEETEDRVNRTSGALKNLLADFDELNIIQSRGGGGGIGVDRNATEQVQLMFEEVGVFNEKIKKIIEYLKNNMEKVRSIATDIGLAILAWNLSAVFTGWLGKLFGLFATAKIVEITFKLSKQFADEYLETGEMGWLVADVLTAVIGSFLAKKVVDAVIGKGWGSVAAGVTLAFSAAADIAASIGNTNVKTLSTQNLILNILAALKAGAAAGIIGYKYLKNGLISLKFGIGVALLTFGASIGIKALLEPKADVYEITEDKIKEDIISALSIGTGTGLIGNSIFRLDAVRSAETGVGAALLWLGANAGIRAFLMDKAEVDKTISLENILFKVTAAIFTGPGAVFLAKGIFNMKFYSAGTAGIGAALVTLGALVALRAILKDKAELDKGFTTETIIRYVSTAIFIGSGLGLWGKGVYMWDTAQVMSATVGASIITLGALVGIRSLLRDEAEVDESISTENITEKVTSALGVAAGFGWLGRNVWDWKWSKVVPAGAGVGLLTLAALIGARAVITNKEGVDLSGITEEKVKEIVEAAMLAGVGGFLLSKYVIRAAAGVGTSVLAGAVTALSVGLAIAAGIEIKAVLENTVDKSEITTENVISIVKSALMTGVAVFGLLSVLGAGAIAAVASGVIAAVATGLIVWALVDAQVKLNTDNIPVEWGNKALTQEQIEEFVSNTMFSIPVKPTLTLLGATVQNTNLATANIQSQLSNLLVTQKVLKLGIKKGAVYLDYDELHKELFGSDGNGGIFGDIQSYINTQEKAISVPLSLLTFTDSEGNDITDTLLSEGLTGYQDVEQYFTNLGKRMGDCFKIGAEGQIEGVNEEMLESLMEEMTEAINALESGQLMGRLTAGMSSDLSKLTRDSFGQVVTTFADYKQQIREGLLESAQEAASSYQGLANFYLARGDRANYEKYMGLANSIYENIRSGSIDAQAEELAAQGKEMIEKALREVYGFIGPSTVKKVGIGKALMTHIKAELNGAIDNPNNIGVRQALSTNVTAYIEEILKRAYGNEEFAQIKQVVEAGLAKYTDFLSNEALNQVIENVIASTGATGEMADSYREILRSILFPDGITSAKSPTSDAVDEIGRNATNTGKTLGDLALTTDNTASRFALFGQSVTDNGKTLTDYGITAENVAGQVAGAVRDIGDAWASIATMNATISASVWFGGDPRLYQYKAEGGFVTTGQMFIAREAGPEMVGTIGNRSAVANNDQIVSGIAGGVSAGQAEQNALLRQQNEYLRMLLAKESTVKISPSAGLAKVVKRSEEMRLKNAGV